MKFFLLLAATVTIISWGNPSSTNPQTQANFDSSHIAHVLDGQVSEWPIDRFHLSDDSTIEYAVDNDDKNLYIAMSIPDNAMQNKIMRNGMELYIDTKGKKKESKGVEFPIKGETGNTSSGLTQTTQPANTDNQPKLDRKTARNVMALGLVALRIFGFENTSHDEQGLTMPGSINIAFKWDAADVMHIEYNVPLELVGNPTSLDKKEISLGWKINAAESPQTEHEHANADANGNSGGGGRGMRGGGRGQFGGGGGGGRGFGNRQGSNFRKLDPDAMRKEQSFWTKYLVENR